MNFIPTRGRGGVQNPINLADNTYGWPLRRARGKCRSFLSHAALPLLPSVGHSEALAKDAKKLKEGRRKRQTTGKSRKPARQRREVL